MATRKAATLYIEMCGKQVDVKEIQKAVARVKGTTTAYVNTAEGCVYCVKENGDSEAVSLV